MTTENEADWVATAPAAEFKTSAEISELATALAKAQGEMEPAVKSAKNPFFKSNYADLGAVMESIRKPFAANGLAVIQGPFATEHGKVIVLTRLLHSSGQWIESALSAEPKDMGAQSVGSVVTYLRRYALSSMAGVSTEDDDGEAGEARGKTNEQPAAAPRSAYTKPPVTTESVLGGRVESATTKRGPAPASTGPRAQPLKQPGQRRLDEETECEHGVSLREKCLECEAHIASAR